MKKITFIFVLLIISGTSTAQLNGLKSKLKFGSDFRFRIEQDWDSKKQDGTFRDDRTRLRYRLRTGVVYKDKWYEAGFRIRTGTPNKQQDPQLTLGKGFKEFGTLPIGLEKAYFKGKWSKFGFWLGKNTFPFEKNNELFWSDNVFPEGVLLQKTFKFNSKVLDSLDLKAGHFILASHGKTLLEDTYFQGYQTYLRLLKKRIELFPSFYLFKNVPNIPDGFETFKMNYAILHIGSRIHLLKKSKFHLTFDFYKNIENYDQNSFISEKFKAQKNGFVTGLKYGKLNQKGDWLFQASYAWIQRYAVLDFMAQNDWVRWDYSSYGSPDGRLSNFNGLEIVAGYKIDKRINLKMKFYIVEQLISYGSTKESGNRIRLDLDIKF